VKTGARGEDNGAGEPKEGAMSQKRRILELVESIQHNAREVRTLVEIEESNFDQSREWPSKRNFTIDDCWMWLCAMKITARRSKPQNYSSLRWIVPG